MNIQKTLTKSQKLQKYSNLSTTNQLAEVKTAFHSPLFWQMDFENVDLQNKRPSLISRWKIQKYSCQIKIFALNCN